MIADVPRPSSTFIKLSVLLATLSAGCGGRQEDVPPAAEAAREDVPGKAYNHDAGPVLSGEVVSHAFTFVNTDDEPIAVTSEEDVRRDCGCSGIVLDAKSLAPGETARVRVTIHTKQKVGPFAHGGTITWSGPSGKKHAVSFHVRGDAREPLTSESTRLIFGPGTADRATAKEIRYRANVPLDWARAKLTSTEPLVRVDGWESNGRQAVVRVACSLPEGVEAANGGITLEVPLSEPAPTLSSVGLTIPVTVCQDVELTLSPKVVPLSWDAATGKASARLMARGTRVAGPQPVIAAITCEGHTVDWRMSDPNGGQSAVVYVELAAANGPPAAEPAALLIDVKGGEPIRLPLINLSGSK